MPNGPQEGADDDIELHHLHLGHIRPRASIKEVFNVTEPSSNRHFAPSVDKTAHHFLRCGTFQKKMI